MKALFIGGTGTIGAAVSRRFLEEGGELTLLNRGNRNSLFSGRVTEILCDINNEEEAAEKLANLSFDAVVDFITFAPAHVERDYRLFRDKTAQYIAFSSASAYQKPLENYLVNESTPLSNPYWEYSRNKIACEETLLTLYREQGFPMTIVRPSHTYDERSVPVGVHGRNGSWEVIRRMCAGKPVIIHGDGTSLWTVTHTSDFARGFTGLMGNTRALGEAVQITSHETLTWNQIYRSIARAVGAELKAVYVSSQFLSQVGPYNFQGGLLGDKAHSLVFDNAKLKRLVPDFIASVRFDSGVRAAVEHIRARPELQREDPEFDRWCDRVVAAQARALEEARNPPSEEET
ncbi:MAG: NAD-dependent epimerase/dehydratase family protein [Spirochaetaceae bacterium]|jgi:nucleoside-diphosphate-sugar epimerase|nr:NAD-dependent epimerase/dehydratase family protein [Spirochaetaceae bacterium]